MRWLIEHEFARLLPGHAGWPSWHDVDAGAFWAGFRNEAPLSVRLGLLGAALLMRAWCWLHPGDGYAAALAHRSYALRQAATVVRTFAAVAYFSDPRVQRLGRGDA